MLNIKKSEEGYYLATLGTGNSVLKKEIKQHAEMKRCRIRFINMDPQVAPAIKKLQERRVQLQDELEQV